jgi:hypothetical protein
LYYLSKEVLLFKDQGDLFPERMFSSKGINFCFCFLRLVTIDITIPATFGQNQKNPSQLDIASSNVSATYGSMLDAGIGMQERESYLGRDKCSRLFLCFAFVRFCFVRLFWSTFYFLRF